MTKQLPEATFIGAFNTGYVECQSELVEDGFIGFTPATAL